MDLTKITKTGINDAAVERAKVGADAIDATKIADDAISEEHLDNTVFTGNAELAEAANASDIFLVYDASAGTIKKILASNVGTQAVTLTSISPTNGLHLVMVQVIIHLQLRVQTLQVGLLNL